MRRERPSRYHASTTRKRNSNLNVESSSKSNNNGKKRKTKLKLKSSFKRFISTVAVILSVIMISSSIAINLLTKDVKPLNKAMLEGRYSHSEIVKIDDVPDNLVNAVVAIEDSRYYSHKGIDFFSLIRVFIKNCIYKTSEGASTLEMQISKNLVTSSEQTLERKIKDMKIAYEMNKSMSKDDIMQVYLNSIYLGRGATGIRAGARIFFAKDVSELNLAECALLAGITKNPSKYTPYNAENIKISDINENLRKNILFNEVLENENNEKSKVDKKVLDELLQNNFINKEQYDLALEGKLLIQKSVLNEDTLYRQKLVLNRMRDLNFISKNEYENALKTKIVIDTSLR